MHALILVDVQNDCLPGGALAVPDGDAVIPVVNRVQRGFALIVVTQDWHPADHGSFAANHPGREPGEVVKLGGLAMKINGFDWHKRARPPGSEELAAAVAPYLLHCIERFGAARAMFESNFPVDKASCSYVVLWNAFKRVTESFSATDRAALFHDTAARVYRL